MFVPLEEAIESEPVGVSEELKGQDSFCDLALSSSSETVASYTLLSLPTTDSWSLSAVGSVTRDTASA